MLSRGSEFSRHTAVLSRLAGWTLAQAEAAAAAGDAVCRSGALTLALPAARVVLEAAGRAQDTNPRSRTRSGPEVELPAAIEALAPGPGAGAAPARLVTLAGQSRGVYFPLAVHLVLRAIMVAEVELSDADRDRVRAITRELDHGATADAGVEQRLWRGLCLIEAGLVLRDRDAVAAGWRVIEPVIAAAPARRAEREAEADAGAGADAHAAPLHERTIDDQLDHWTYRELAGLHALADIARLAGDPSTRDAARPTPDAGSFEPWTLVDCVARFHLEHTQPDYTTYEPWAIHAFIRWPDMRVFADQQLHDMQTNVHVSGREAALVPALLLADACLTGHDAAEPRSREG